MSALVKQADFKKLISGSTTVAELYSGYIVYPSIIIRQDENKIIVKGDFELEDIVFEKGESFEKEIFFDGGVFRNIIFRGGYFKKIFFRRGIFNGFVSIRGGTIENLILLGGTFNHWLGTLDGNKNTDNGVDILAEEPLLIKRFEIEGGIYTNNIWISGGEIDSLEIKCVTPVKIHCKPNDDKIFDTIQNKYTKRFTSSPDIRNLVISRYSNKDNFFHFSELELDTIKFENFTNLSNITIAKVKLNKNICFENSDLGKTSFIDCDFSNQIMNFDSSKITEVALAGAKLPEPSRIISLTADKKGQKRLALSQIKKIYLNMGDAVTAASYQAQELDTYRSILKPSWEKFNLWLNLKTNNYGQSWERALKVLLVGTILLYTLYCFSLGLKFELSQIGFLNFLKNAGYYLEFLNPIRKGDFLPKVLIGAKEETEVPALAYAIDSISKIFSAYLIYQLIAAFRKHGKKSE